MKNTIAYLLLFYFTLNPLAFYIMLELHKLYMTSELEKNNDKGKITVLAIPDPDTAGSFHRNNTHEISYQGRYYDVVKEERKNGHLLFYCIHDNKEETLISFMKKLTRHKLFSFPIEDVVKIFPGSNHLDHLIPSSEMQFPGLTLLMKSMTPPTFTPPPEQS